MLIELRIRDFAIIEALTLPLAPGFNVLSGETGAGKSIIVDALGLLLGDRASSDSVRTGATRASVEGVFEVPADSALLQSLDDRGIEVDDGLLVLKREVVTTGRARAWINGTTVTAGALAEVGRQLVSLHGQHEAQTLLDQESQRRILDAFAGSTPAAVEVKESFDRLAEVRRQIADLSRRREQAEQRADYLRHVVREIDAAAVTAGEDLRLEEEARRLEHAEELRTTAGHATALLQDAESGVIPILGQLQRALGAIQRIDPSLDRLQEVFDTGYYSLEELARALEEYEAGVELDPERLAEVQARRDLLFGLTRKYGGTLEEVLEAGRRASEELELVDGAGLDLRQLEGQEIAAREALGRAAARLTDQRTDGARRLELEVDAVLPELGMSDGHLQVELRQLGEVGMHGAEDIEFRVTLNVGHDPRPLARVASGGELSRVMLALKTILARVDAIPTLVFDEVDAGIGGRVGLQVGDAMRRLAEHHQLFAISHLPQLAARAHHHILVSKGARGGVTTADVRVLDGEDRVREVARMLGGDPDSEISRAHARELLDTATRRADTPQRRRPKTPR